MRREAPQGEAGLVRREGHQGEAELVYHALVSMPQGTRSAPDLELVHHLRPFPIVHPVLLRDEQ
jgi:hypothetical protein